MDIEKCWVDSKKIYKYQYYLVYYIQQLWESTMIERIRNNKNRSYFFLYSFIKMGYGFAISAFGPLIPFLAAFYDLPETAFKFMFVCRTIGFLLGNISAKFMHKFFNYHNLIAIGITISSIAHIFFAITQTITPQSVWLFTISMALGLVEVYISLSLLESHKGDDESYWFQLNQGAGGIGFLLGPLLVGLLGIKSYIWIGVVIMTPTFMLRKMRSPQLSQQHETKKQLKQQQKISLKTQFFICVTLFLLFGTGMGYSGWISSYLVIQNLQTKEQAVVVSSVFWVSISMFVFVLVDWKGIPHQKLFILTKLQITTLIISIVLQNIGYIRFSAYFCSLFLGISFSCMYALIFSIPYHFGKKLCPDSTSNILIVAGFGEGIVAPIYGQGIDLFGTKSLYIMTLTYAVLMFISIKFIVNSLQTDPYSHINSKFESDRQLSEILVRQSYH